MQKAKELPPAVLEGTHWTDKHMDRRIKEFRAKNPEGDNLMKFFTETIGPANVLDIHVNQPESEQLSKMKEIIEQKGKPCCINMITEGDRKYVASLSIDPAAETQEPVDEIT